MSNLAVSSKVYLPSVSNKTKPGGFTKRVTLIKHLRKGFDYKLLETLKADLGLSTPEFGAIINITARTLNRRKKEGLLHPDESERVYRLRVLLDFASEVLGDKQTAISWLKTDNLALGNKAPLAYADTEVGIEEIKELLGRIEHGVFS